jgi:hypothetical protein
LQVFAAERGCALANLSLQSSVLPYPRARWSDVAGGLALPIYDADKVAQAKAEEARADYIEPSGRYWERMAEFDVGVIDRIDSCWVAAFAG